MIAFAAISGAVSDEDIQDIALELLENLGTERNPCQRLILCAEGIGDAASLSKLASNQVAIYEGSISDSHILCACLEYLRGSSIDEKILVDEVGSPSPFPRPLSDAAGLEHIDRLLAVGQPRLASAAAGGLRKDLQMRGTLLCASLAECLRELMLYADAKENCNSPTFPDSGSVLSRRGIDGDAWKFLDLREEALARFRRSCPTLNDTVEEDLAFVNEGRALAKVAFRADRQKFDFFVWLSIYFLRTANYRLSRQECAEALSLAIRALECYSIYYLTLPPEIYLDGGSFYWRESGRKVVGTGELFSRLQARIDFRAKKTIAEDIRLCDEAIDLRNRSIFGHGLQKIKSDHLAPYTSAVRRLIAVIEGLDPAAEARWVRLWEKSCPTNEQILARLVSKALIASRKFGDF